MERPFMRTREAGLSRVQNWMNGLENMVLVFADKPVKN